MQVMKMVLTVQGTSQVPVYSGWVFSWVPLSFLFLLSSNVSLRSQLHLRCIQTHSAAFRCLGTCFMYSMSDLTCVQKWNRVGCGQCCAEIGLQRCFIGAHGGLRIFENPFLPLVSSVLSFTHLTSSPTSFFFMKRRELMWQTFPN